MHAQDKYARIHTGVKLFFPPSPSGKSNKTNFFALSHSVKMGAERTHLFGNIQNKSCCRRGYCKCVPLKTQCPTVRSEQAAALARLGAVEQLTAVGGARVQSLCYLVRTVTPKLIAKIVCRL